MNEEKIYQIDTDIEQRYKCQRPVTTEMLYKELMLVKTEIQRLNEENKNLHRDNLYFAGFAFGVAIFLFGVTFSSLSSVVGVKAIGGAIIILMGLALTGYCYHLHMKLKRK